jgi:hypothetical protein
LGNTSLIVHSLVLPSLSKGLKHLFWKKISYLDAKPCSLLSVHKYTQDEQTGEWVAQIFALGVSKLSGKITRGSPVLAFIAFSSRSSLKIAGGGSEFPLFPRVHV